MRSAVLRRAKGRAAVARTMVSYPRQPIDLSVHQCRQWRRAIPERCLFRSDSDMLFPTTYYTWGPRRSPVIKHPPDANASPNDVDAAAKKKSIVNGPLPATVALPGTPPCTRPVRRFRVRAIGWPDKKIIEMPLAGDTIRSDFTTPHAHTHTRTGRRSRTTRISRKSLIIISLTVQRRFV